ncbi:hypothetical protein J6590_048367 [Homalodisca vitripennis]|nr:hypothetical protein J6590_048367 [Homalodisca vitripennis]
MTAVNSRASCTNATLLVTVTLHSKPDAQSGGENCVQVHNNNSSHRPFTLPRPGITLQGVGPDPGRRESEHLAPHSLIYLFVNNNSSHRPFILPRPGITLQGVGPDPGRRESEH